MEDIEDSIVTLFEDSNEVKFAQVECIEKTKILSTIKSSDLPFKVKEKLCILNSMVNMAKKRVIPMPNTILLRTGSKNRELLLKIIESLYIEKEVCNNEVYELSHTEQVSSYNDKKKAIIIKQIKRDKELYLNLPKDDSTSLLIYLVPRDDDGIMEDFNGLSSVISMVIDVAYSPVEILDFCRNIANEFSMKIEIDVGPEHEFFNDSVSMTKLDAALRNLLYSKVQNAIRNQIPLKNMVVPLSTIINSYVNPFAATKDVENNNTEENDNTNSKYPTFDDIIGLDIVKQKFNRISAFIKKTNSNEMSKHMAFLGNPGTGKTIMARAFAHKLFEEEITDNDNFVEVDRADLVGEYIGQTTKKTRDVFEKARGGVLFIDEAYSLFISPDDKKDYGNEVISTLIKLMEDNRDNTIIIFAGYKEEMQRLIKSNPGLKSRIQFQIEFPDYSNEELLKIMDLQLSKTKFVLSNSAKNEIVSLIDKEREKKEFGNGRFIRNLLEGIELIQSARTKIDDYIISKEDVLTFESEMQPEEKVAKFGF